MCPPEKHLLHQRYGSCFGVQQGMYPCSSLLQIFHRQLVLPFALCWKAKHSLRWHTSIATRKLRPRSPSCSHTKHAGSPPEVTDSITTRTTAWPQPCSKRFLALEPMEIPPRKGYKDHRVPKGSKAFKPGKGSNSSASSSYQKYSCSSCFGGWHRQRRQALSSSSFFASQAQCFRAPSASNHKQVFCLLGVGPKTGWGRENTRTGWSARWQLFRATSEACLFFLLDWLQPVDIVGLLQIVVAIARKSCAILSAVQASNCTHPIL